MIINSIQSLEFVANNHMVYIVGAGNYGKILGEYFKRTNISWNGYIDKMKAGGQYIGKNIYSFNYSFPDNSVFIIAASFAAAEQLKKQLMFVGVSQERIYEIDCYDNDIIYRLMIDQQEIIKLEKEMYKLKNCYQGKRCFIIGNGPSLCIEDLDKLVNEITFACNSIYALYPYTKWRPTCYAYTDALGLERLAEDNVLPKILREDYFFFTSYTAKKIISSYMEDVHSHIYYMKTINGINESENGVSALFSEECDKKVYTIGSVLYTLCQLAIYMGINEIILLGVDMNYSVERKYTGEIIENNVVDHQDLIQREDMRFADDIKKYHGSMYMGYVDNQLAGFLAMKMCADKHGVKVYNATRGGKLEVFERKSFDSMF